MGGAGVADAAGIVSQFGFPKENGTGLVIVISQMRRGAQEVEGTCPKSHDPPWQRWNWNSGVVQQSIEHLSLGLSDQSSPWRKAGLEDRSSDSTRDFSLLRGEADRELGFLWLCAPCCRMFSCWVLHLEVCISCPYLIWTITIGWWPRQA